MAPGPPRRPHGLGGVRFSSVVALSLLIAGCGGHRRRVATTPDPAIAGWVRFTSADGSFSVSWPSEPTASDARGGKLSGTRMAATQAEQLFAVLVLDAPRLAAGGPDPGALAAAALSDGVESIEDATELLESAEITVEGNPGRRLRVRTGNGDLLGATLVAADGRVFVILVGWHEKDPAPPKAGPFVASFRLRSKS